MKKKKPDLFDICNYIFMLLLLFITVYPLYFTVIASLSDPKAVATGKVTWRPVGLTLDSYRQVFEYKPIWTGYANTILYTLAGTFFNLFLTIPAAYTLSKKYLPGKNILMGFFMLTMYFSGGMIPTYLLVKNLGLVNSRWSLIILGGISIYNLIVTKTFFGASISESLYEAARIDGAGEIKTFLSIALPLAKPIVAVIALYYAVGHWNDYFMALLYVSDKDKAPLQTVLREILIQNQNALDPEKMKRTMSEGELIDSAKRVYTAYAMKYSMVFIASAPLLAVYPFIQKYFVKGVMIGAVKE